MTELSGYVLETLREGGEFTLYRGWQHGNPLPVLVLTPVAEQPTPASLKQLEHEYSLAAELDAAWAARPLALARHEGRMMLVLEDLGGEPLDRFLGQPLELTRFLPLAIGLTAALGQLHQRGLIHKDVKPANILVNLAGGVWLTGFGIASRVPREHQSPEPPEFIAGTLAYMAPEQTGRMNRSMDSRSDLYSLGVTLYEMLIGSLPFTASDPMEWIHCHIARKPVPPSERLTDIPAPVSAIILKLLAKTAEERYQTAAGVEADLCRCLAEWESRRRIDTFTLGAHDTPDRLLIPEKLYGRAREIDTLLASFERVVASGTPELVLVSGYSGIGKSSVVNELHKVLVPPHGLFAAGKFDQYKRDIPYATLAQAFRNLIRPLLSKSEKELSKWRDTLCEALGPNGLLIVDLVPELKLIIGEQPPVPDLPPQEAQNRFQMVFRRFLGVFARKEHPLALFLDDLQWLDTATLELLEHLVTHDEVRHLLLVAAYRDNEVGLAHPLLQTLAAIRKADARVQEIVLAPLRLGDVGRLVADALHCEPERALPLAQLVYEKTGGNPFFAIQFFTALADERLLAFDAVALTWQWDIDRIRAKSYTDNVVELMVGKLSRLPDETQDALTLLACLGNAAETATLTMMRGESEQENREQAMHTALWEAVRAGLLFRLESAYAFPHDRIQQAAYSLIPDAQRAAVHLRISRALLANMTATELDERLFDVANQLERAAVLLVDREEKTGAATINLRAARKAKASAAYASARVYLAAGIALLDETYWASEYDLMFSLRLDAAACEYLTGEFDRAEQLIAELLQRGASRVDLAAVYYQKVLLHIVRSQHQQAVDSGHTCLRLFGIHMPAHPTWEQVQAEYEMIWRNLEGRPIEALIDLPLMTDPELQAATRVLSVLTDPAYVTDQNLFCLQLCRIVNLSMRYGANGASAHAYGFLGFTLGPIFKRYPEGLRLAKLAGELVEKHGFLAYRAKVQQATAIAAFWTQPMATAIDFNRASIRTAIENGDLTYACYGMYHVVTLLLLRNDPLDAVWRESEIALDFVHRAKFRDMEDTIVPLQRFIAMMQGRTASFSTFNDAQFDEAAFEAQLTGDRMPTMFCWYWTMKAKARYLSGDYADALAAADKATALLWSSTAHFPLLDYYYYTALTVAALYGSASADERNGWRDRLAAYQVQLHEWAENYPPTFGDKHALVAAEIARLEGRDADAMRLYETAIQLAREHGFVQNEGLAHEVAARFYAARGVETIAHTYLRNARYCYLRWGAEGKVRQLELLYRQFHEDPTVSAPTAMFDAPVKQLEVETVVKASQALSSEIVLSKLVEKLMRIALEHAGAERGLLILPRGGELRIEAEATTSGDTVIVGSREVSVTAAALPESIVHYVVRTQESVILDDASAQKPFSADPYIREHRARSILCLPLLKQAKLTGVLYLENNLAAHVFNPRRIAVLKVLASQAAISLENTRLYGALEKRQAKIRRLVEANIIGIFIWNLEGEITEANEAFLHMVGYSREDLVSGRVRWTDLTPGQWRDRDERAVANLKAVGTVQPFEKEYFRKDGSRVPVLVGVGLLEGRRDEGVAFVLDLTERKRAEDALHKTQAELAHVTRVTTVGELTASIAHEVNQPLTAVIANANASLRWLGAATPNLDEVRDAVGRIARDGKRAGEVIARIRALVQKSDTEKVRLDINQTVQEVVILMQNEAVRKGVAIRMDLAADVPPVLGDRIQLQQVILNLVMNGIEAMDTVTDRPREMLIRSCEHESDHLLVAVQDSGTGIDPQNLARIFDTFYTTKSQGMGMGLAICRSIVENHGGRLWAVPNDGPGATFQFTLQACGNEK